MLLSGKKIFITAAGQGIGRAITERFIRRVQFWLRMLIMN